MKISKFLNDELADYASYSTLRAVSSLIDGQKNSSRKVLYTVQQKNITTKTKVSNLNSITALHTEYLHGDQILNDVIVKLSRDFVGNNMPLLLKKGNFGTKFEPEASAPRYIFTMKHPRFDKIFNKIDDNILPTQNFEGVQIEHKFMMPSIPLLLVNGNEGIATGFAQKILPRKLESIIEYIEAKNNGTTLPFLPPHYNGFEGTIEKGDNNRQWFIKGNIVKKSITTVWITELPVGYSLSSYTKKLHKMKDNKIIKSFKDLSDNNKFKFELVMTAENLRKYEEGDIYDKLNIVKTVTENYTAIDENNRVVNYDNIEGLFDHYIRVKLEYMQKRKDYIGTKLKEDISVLASKYLFIKHIQDGDIIVNKKTKIEIIEQLKNFPKIQEGDNYDYLLRLPIYSLTVEKLQDIKDQILNKKQEYEKNNNTHIKDMWMDDVNYFKGSK